MNFLNYFFRNRVRKFLIIVFLSFSFVTGQEISMLVNEIKSEGEYSLDFNASGLSTGTYFYRLESRDFEKTKRMMLIK